MSGLIFASAAWRLGNTAPKKRRNDGEQLATLGALGPVISARQTNPELSRLERCR